MKIGHIWYRSTPEDAILTQQAAELFNALGGSVTGAAEYGAEVRIKPREDSHDVRVRLGFLAGNHLVDIMSWNECIAAIKDAETYLAQRPAAP